MSTESRDFHICDLCGFETQDEDVIKTYPVYTVAIDPEAYGSGIDKNVMNNLNHGDLQPYEHSDLCPMCAKSINVAIRNMIFCIRSDWKQQWEKKIKEKENAKV